MKTIVKRIIIMFALVIGISALANAQSKTPIKASELQKNITDNISKDYVDYTISKAFKVVTKTNKIQYNVNIVKDDKWFRLIYDNNGKLIKAVELNSKSNKKKTANTPK